MTTADTQVTVTQADCEAAERWKSVWGSFAHRLPVEDLAYALSRHRLAAEKQARDAERAALRPITMQDVRLAVGEGKLTAADALAGCNAELRRRAALAEPMDSDMSAQEVEP